MKSLSAIVVSLSLLLTPHLSNAQQITINACMNKNNGLIRILKNNGQCIKRVETPISWNAYGQSGPPISSSGIKVYDANDHFLGLLVGHNDPYSIEIYISQLKRSLSFDLFFGATINIWPIFYEDSNCAGKAYTHRPLSVVIALPQYDNIGNVINRTYYISGESEILPAGTINSSFFGTNTCNSSRNGADAQLWPLIEIPADQIPFTLPLALPLRYESE